MSDKPILLFLHGVGKGDVEDNWKIRLSANLINIGFPDLDQVHTIAPKYADLLHRPETSSEVIESPPITWKKMSKVAAHKKRRDFERQISAMEYRLGRHSSGNGGVFPTTMVSIAVELPWFLQARNYLNKPEIRAQVLTRILSELPDQGRLVIIGHSLGSVIAADLLRRLPQGIAVSGLVTMGSPLANGNFNVDRLREEMEDPPQNLAWWVNAWSATDPVAAKRGVSSVFPWILDHRIQTPLIPGTAHAAVEYLADEGVGEAIGFGLFGSRSKELVVAETGLDIPLDPAELLVVQALRYSYLIKSRLKDDDLDRYEGALRQVHKNLIDDIIARNNALNRPVPREIAELDFDFGDPTAAAPEPRPSMHMTKEAAVTRVLELATENLIRPFEIKIKEEITLEALKDLTAEMGLSSQFGADAFHALKTSVDELAQGRRNNWFKLGLLGVGAVAIAAASGGLALAAAPGVAGAAAITSALASFGPGGMIGGLLTAGTLVSAGSSGIAVGMLNPGTTAEAVEAFVEYQLAVVILRDRHQLDQDPTIWASLSHSELKLRREIERLDEFSDDNAPSLKQLKQKLHTVEKALKYLSKNGLEPGIVAETSSQEANRFKKPVLGFLGTSKS